MLRRQQAAASLVSRGLRRPVATRIQSIRRLPLLSTPTSVPASVQLLAGFSSTRQANGRNAKPKSSPSFEIAAAFEGHDDLEDEVEDDESDASDSSRKPRRRRVDHDVEEDEAAQKAVALSEQFRAGMEKKRRWLQALAERGDFAAVAKSVADCYTPLYTSVGSAIGAQSCPLVQVYTQAAGEDADEVETKFQPQRFDDTLAKLTEQEALALLVVAQQAPLAIAIVEHRLQLAQQLATASISSSTLAVEGDSVMDDRPLALTPPFRSFFSWAVGAYSFVQDFPAVLDTYERALAADVYPTANMNATFLSALVALGRYKEAFAFYDRVAADNRPVSVFFYRQLLFAVSVAQDSALAQRVVDDMKRKGFKLRAEDYQNAIRAFDNDYFMTPRTIQRGKQVEREQLAPPMDRYTTCIDRNQEREDDPDAFHELDEATKSVLTLYDEAVELTTVTSRHAALFPRAITAAVFLEEFDKVLEIVDLHTQVADGDRFPLHFTGVRMAVNAFLMLDQPAEGWEFVKRTYLSGEKRQCAPHFANIVDYLCIHDRVSDVLSLVGDARELEMQDLLLSNTVAKTIIPTLCRNVDSIEDKAVWDALVGPASGFGVLTSPYWCELFIDHCSRNGRMELVARALEKRSRKKVPVIKPRLALHLMTRFEERGELENVTKVFSAMDKQSAKAKGGKDIHERVVQVVSRVYEKLGMEDASRRLRRKHTPTETAKQQTKPL